MGAYVGLAPLGFPNVALSNFAKDYRNNAFVGDLICPRVPVDRQSFPYIIWTQDDFRVPTTLRAPGNAPGSFRNNYTEDTYFCKSHALETEIPFESEAYSLGLGFSARQRATKSLTKRLNLAREAEIAAIALSTVNFPNGTSLNGNSMWDSYITTPTNDTETSVTSHPIVDVETGKEALRQVGIMDEEMVLILSSPVIRVLVNHPDIIERFKFTNTLGVIDLQKLSSVFGVKCLRAGAVQLSQNNVKSWVWGNNAFLGYAQSSPDLEDLSCMKTFSWTGEEDGGIQKGMVARGADGFAVLEWIDSHLSKKKYWQSADWYYQIKVTAQETGYPILNAVSGDTMETVPSDIEG
jgi:hypothetical protein